MIRELSFQRLTVHGSRPSVVTIGPSDSQRWDAWRLWCVALILLLSVVGSAAAQDPPSARVTESAPIFIRPGATTPLRVAAVGTVLRVLLEEGEWVQVQFQDPQWGLRTGWVKADLIAVQHPELRPMDLSVPNAPVAAAAAAQSAAHDSQAPFPTAETVRPQSRDGFWFNVGLGFGSLGCEDCVARQDGLSGGLSLGGVVGEKMLLGVGTTGWAKDIEGELLTVGTLDLRVRFYPVRTSGFFLTAGIGAGSVSYLGESDFGLGAVLGVGWDIRVGQNVSLTPFWNGFAMANSNVDANVGQIGLGVTIH